jgi:Holliday junction resolvase RusA-like endonuclease
VVYENTISAAALAAMAVAGLGRRYGGPVTVTVSCYFPDARRRDADNVLKSALDGMIDVVYADDCQVQTATVTKAIDRERPRTEVTVTYG